MVNLRVDYLGDFVFLEISYSGSLSMITGAGRGSERCWKVLGVTGLSIETWNTG